VRLLPFGYSVARRLAQPVFGQRTDEHIPRVSGVELDQLRPIAAQDGLGRLVHHGIPHHDARERRSGFDSINPRQWILHCARHPVGSSGQVNLCNLAGGLRDLQDSHGALSPVLESSTYLAIKCAASRVRQAA